MAKLIRAHITPDVLRWARESLHLTIEDAAGRARVPVAKLEQWEKGETLPTINQARSLAKTYRQPFALFYLPESPAERIRIPKDFRRVAGTTIDGPSYNILSSIHEAVRRREIALDVLSQLKLRTPLIKDRIGPTEDEEQVGSKVRGLLRIPFQIQREWRDKRVAFNSWRAAVERLGTLVFQEADLQLDEFRGYSLFERPLPVIVVNRKDAYAGRTFTLIHELSHILLNYDGLCDLVPDPSQPPEDQRVEVFCNATAASCLMPSIEVLKHPLLNMRRSLDGWSDEEISELAIMFAVSRETMLRRLLTLGRTSNQFYERKREEYLQEARRRKKQEGFVPPPRDALSKLGRPYVRLVLDGYRSRTLTASDASEVLGLRMKHFSKLAEAVGAI